MKRNGGHLLGCFRGAADESEDTSVMWAPPPPAGPRPLVTPVEERAERAAGGEPRQTDVPAAHCRGRWCHNSSSTSSGRETPGMSARRPPRADPSHCHRCASWWDLSERGRGGRAGGPRGLPHRGSTACDRRERRPAIGLRTSVLAACRGREVLRASRAHAACPAILLVTGQACGA